MGDVIFEAIFILFVIPDEFANSYTVLFDKIQIGGKSFSLRSLRRTAGAESTRIVLFGGIFDILIDDSKHIWLRLMLVFMRNLNKFKEAFFLFRVVIVLFIVVDVLFISDLPLLKLN